MFGRILGIGVAVAAASVALIAPPATANVETWSCEGDVIVGSTGNDFLVGTDCDDIIAARRGNDVLTGRAGADFLAGGWGNDVLRDAADDNAWGTVDVLRGGRGFDRCVGDEGDEFISCEIVFVR
jgi:Ca2+-binding RTX toxin-like protein